MNEARVRQLAEAYGADIAKWPAAERAAASAHALAEGSDWLAEAARLDRLLEADAAAAPSSALRDRVIGLAPLARGTARAWRWLTAAGLGLGFAAAGLAGVAAGFTLAPPSVTRLVSGEAFAPASEDVAGLADPDGDLAGI